MQRIRLSQNVILEITDEFVSRALNTTPYVHIYEYGAANMNNKQVVYTDGQTEERTKSFWANNGNILLTTTPNFYPDAKVATSFHTNHRIDTLLSPTVLSSSLQYRKVRMLFAEGFAYSTGTNAVALTTLNISAIRPSNNARIDLLSFFDVYDNSSIQAVPQVLYDNQLFNSGIDLHIIDIAYLYNSTQTDVVAVRNRLFGTDEVETLFIEHAGVQFSDITSFSEFGNTYKKFADSNKTRTQYSPRFNNNEIVCEVKKTVNGTVTAEMKHERFAIQPFLEKTSKVTNVEYTYKFDQYNASNTLLGSNIVKVSNPTALFNKAEFRLNEPLTGTDHINVTVEGRIFSENNSQVFRSGSIVITDVSVLKTLALTATLSEEKLVQSVTKQIKQVTFKPDTPKIINIEKPVYIQVQPVSTSITLVPFTQSIKLTNEVDTSLSRELKLVIGNLTYTNIPNDKMTFKVTEEAYHTKSKKWFLLDENQVTVAYGDIKRVEV